ncbi:membrane associated rhomboid family serine protease [Rhodovulum bhavnagarense]|uniref:Membrane associated rhomboid family serine protease n=1 Tax=Rhodovulum bhavnagarense TaxID=992286 RepID=A0A4V2SWN0_9RHOB|nr:rhomboid family intramembrane serine protease [Rhodovulum bhavnagarense]TCP63076.1 membrane associated rhomboid family serine protease [Rhodovulum bhavnagarense]
MFPLRDHNPSNRTPYVTYALIAINVAVFLSYWPLFSDPQEVDLFFTRWGLVPAAITEGYQAGGVVTSMFLHGGLLHLGGNMLFLWIFGDNLEDEMGHAGFALFYLACGIAAGLGQYLADPLSMVPMVGASGAIAGVMGGYLLMFPKARVDILFVFLVFFKVIPIPAWLMLGAWFGLQLLAGAGTTGAEDGIAYWAHSGGFAAGLLLALPLWRRRGGAAYWARTHGQPPHPEVSYRTTTIPTVRRRR